MKSYFPCCLRVNQFSYYDYSRVPTEATLVPVATDGAYQSGMGYILTTSYNHGNAGWMLTIRPFHQSVGPGFHEPSHLLPEAETVRLDERVEGFLRRLLWNKNESKRDVPAAIVQFLNKQF
ncbi:hypothetical protein JW930_05765 [Candidatus Woesearchaeota archaeon]|nr:hypothetical protein [Candidatus Woesearchaeota archaeon]